MNATIKIARILQIEDDVDILEISRIAIELSAGIDLYQASTGREALEMLPGIHPDVILLDVMMPDMDGPETLSRIRELGFGSVPVIFLTARARENDLSALMLLDVAGIIIKPFDPLTLLRQVQTTVDRAKVQKS